MGHWFVRWLIYTYIVHLVAQIAVAQALDYIFVLNASEWLGHNRPLVAMVLCLHFACYFIAQLASVERDQLDALAKERLKDD